MLLVSPTPQHSNRRQPKWVHFPGANGRPSDNTQHIHSTIKGKRPGESSLSLPKDNRQLGVTGMGNSATTSSLTWEASLRTMNISYGSKVEKISDFEFVYLKQHQTKGKVLLHWPESHRTMIRLERVQGEGCLGSEVGLWAPELE